MLHHRGVFLRHSVILNFFTFWCYCKQFL